MAAGNHRYFSLPDDWNRRIADVAEHGLRRLNWAESGPSPRRISATRLTDSRPKSLFGGSADPHRTFGPVQGFTSLDQRPDAESAKGAGAAGIKNFRAAVETIRSNQGTGGISSRPSRSTGKSLILIQGLHPYPNPRRERRSHMKIF